MHTRVGEIIRRRRKVRGMSQGQLARLIGPVSPALVSHYECGKRSVPLDKLDLIGEALGLDAEELSAAWEEDNRVDFGFNVPAPGIINRWIPVVGKTNCGDPGDWTDSNYAAGVADEYIAESVSGENVFALRVVGDSMSPYYIENDIVVCDPSREVHNGNHVVACVGGEKTCKIFQRDGEMVFLRPINPQYEILHVPVETLDWVYPVIKMVRSCKR